MIYGSSKTSIQHAAATQGSTASLPKPITLGLGFYRNTSRVLVTGIRPHGITSWCRSRSRCGRIRYGRVCCRGRFSTGTHLWCTYKNNDRRWKKLVMRRIRDSWEVCDIGLKRFEEFIEIEMRIDGVVVSLRLKYIVWLLLLGKVLARARTFLIGRCARKSWLLEIFLKRIS